MNKLEVGHLWDIPEGYEEYGRIGGYIMAIKDGELSICGDSIFNLTVSPILATGLMPIDKEQLEKLIVVNDGKETGLAHIFEYKDNHIYYLVTYGLGEPDETLGSGSFIFEDLYDAVNMLGMFVDFKAQSLKGK